MKLIVDFELAIAGCSADPSSRHQLSVLSCCPACQGDVQLFEAVISEVMP
ncbi:MAG: hypothetical protein KC502_14035 [Myxococcales bacterium]|nr:hypothetical protein [Myxococcales bacterium]